MLSTLQLKGFLLPRHLPSGLCGGRGLPKRSQEKKEAPTFLTAESHTHCVCSWPIAPRHMALTSAEESGDRGGGGVLGCWLSTSGRMEGRSEQLEVHGGGERRGHALKPARQLPLDFPCHSLLGTNIHRSSRRGLRTNPTSFRMSTSG